MFQTENRHPLNYLIMSCKNLPQREFDIYKNYAFESANKFKIKRKTGETRRRFSLTNTASRKT